MAWQLINTKTNEVLHGPGPLPENWGPISGVAGFLDTHGDLSILGDEFIDMEWVRVPDPGPKESELKSRAMQLLTETAWATWPDAPITVRQKKAWLKYRKELWRIYHNAGKGVRISFPPVPED